MARIDLGISAIYCWESIRGQVRSTRASITQYLVAKYAQDIVYTVHKYLQTISLSKVIIILWFYPFLKGKAYSICPGYRKKGHFEPSTHLSSPLDDATMAGIYHFCPSIQVNLFQKHLFLQQLTHNMTKDCSLIYQFLHENYKLRTCCVHKLF